MASKPWARAVEVREAILAYCRDDWRTLDAISKALRRKPYTVRRHLAPLVAEKLLLTRFAEATHPQQAYRAGRGVEAKSVIEKEREDDSEA
ncbi:MAG: hypothetical protein HYV07_08090 [Deltaproteobacteria bacterium]|nr:hypothetical protein [Deltaproteobacteria bacterium]